MEAQRITISLDDREEGASISPQRVRLGDLVRFAEDVKAFLQGDGKELDATGLEVRVLEGSFALQTQPIDHAPKLFQDLQALAHGTSLDVIDRNRRAVIERWQRSARMQARLVYAIAAPCLPRPLRVDASSDYHADDADQWVRVERYVAGEIQDLGGVNRANAHVRLADGKSLRVETDKAFLRDDKANRLYKNAMLRIRAEYNLRTRELRNAHLLEFVEQAPDVDEAALARMKAQGAVAWKDVDDAAAWVDELREGRR